MPNDNFEKEVLESKIPVLIDFWAMWCGSCKTIAPMMDELAQLFDGKVKIAKLNVDKNPSITENCLVFNIPTLIFFKNGKEVDRMVGINPKAKILKRIEELL